MIYQWVKRFKEVRVSFKDDPRSGRPSSASNEEIVAQIGEKIFVDRRLIVRKIINEVNISSGSC